MPRTPSTFPAPPRARKRLFIGLITGSSVLVCLVLVGLWIVPVVGLGAIHPLAPWLLGTLVLSAILALSWASLALVLNILLGRPVLGGKRLRGVTVRVFLPLMTMLGRALGIPPQDVQASFIRVNNELVSAEGLRVPAERILVLVPHCLQQSRCPQRLTYDVDHCRRCGLCDIGELLKLRDALGLRLAVATGGTIARRIVVENRPQLIIAVACERDLAHGIQDTFPIPVFGILNQRPHGPCRDTRVMLEEVRKAVERFMAGTAA